MKAGSTEWANVFPTRVGVDRTGPGRECPGRSFPHARGGGPEALAVKDGRILAVGTRAELEKSYQGEATKRVDLAGKTLVPGFIDGHSHFMDSLAAAGRANISAPPVGPAQSTHDGHTEHQRAVEHLEPR